MITLQPFSLSLLCATALTVVCASCGKSAPATTGDVVAVSAEKALPAGVLAVDAALEARLSAVYHPLRCAYVLNKSNVAAILTKNNFASAEAYADAFAAQTKVHPEWARGVLDASYKLPCNDVAIAAAPRAQAEAPTPSAAP